MKRLLGVLLAVAGGTGGLASPVAAGPPTVCRFQATFTISPGLGAVPTSGTFTSHGERGTLDCEGPVDGRNTTGTGHFGATGRYGVQGPDTCAMGEGTALQSFTLPSRGGSVHFTNPVTFTWRPEPGFAGDPSAPLVIGAGRFRGPRMSGTLVIVPLEGDCVTAPVTRAIVHLRGTLAQAVQ